METIIVVHGTFASEGRWWRRGGDFCNKLDRILEAKKHPARCWAHLPPHGRTADDEFCWSGENSQVSRSHAASSLKDYLEALIKQEHRGVDFSDNEAQNFSIHLIGHSHGGNVILDALVELGPSELGLDSDMFPEDQYPIKSVTLLGTPYLKTKHRGTEGLFFGIIAFSILLLYVCLVVAILAGIGVYLWSIIDPTSLPITLEDVGNAYLFGILGLFATFAFAAFTRQLFASKPPFKLDYDVNFISSKYDEAVALLKLAARTKLDCKELAEKYVDLNYDPPLCNRSMALKRYFEKVRDEAKSYTNPLSIVQLIFILILGFPFALVLLLDCTLFRGFSLGASLVTRWGLRSGLRTMAQKILGDDHNLMPIEAVLDVPCADQSKSLNQISLSEAIEREMVSQSTDEVKNSADTIYSVLTELSHSDETQNAMSKLRTIYDSANSVHCQYYRNEKIIRLISDLIRKA